MPWWTWVSVGVFLVVFVVGAALTVGIARTVRAARTTQHTTTTALDRFLEGVDALERRLAALEEERARVEQRTESLRRSFAKLSLLGWALADSREAVTRLRKAVPRK